MSDSLDTIFKAYDVRGVFPDEIDEGIAKKIGNAFVRFTGASTVVVGYDMRPSSVPLSRAFIDGATMAGADVVDVGLASTDLVYFAAGSLDAPAAMFTASHNPAQYNGVKMCRAGAAPIGEATGLQQIKEAVAAGLLERAEEVGQVHQRDLLEDFAAHVRSFVDARVLRPLKVVADTANGMGGLVVPRVFAGLPFDLTVLFGELDGTFPNHPADPIQPENLVALQKAVLESGADVGLAFDGDADRVFLVDDRGEPVSGSTTTAIVAKSMLQRAGGGT
ncbi:MAG: phosphomannomutase/phosphoglucomutase, partial [Acidimicrobiia bacterium]